MLNEIRIENFKAYGSQEQALRLGRITIFIGENGTGKSSALQALTLLAQSANQNAIKLMPGESFWFVNYRDIVHKMEPGRKLTIGYEGRISHEAQGYSAQIMYAASFAEQNRDNMLVEQWGKIKTESWTRIPLPDMLEGKYYHGDSTANPQRLEGDGFHVSLGSSDRVCKPIQITGGGHTTVEQRHAFEDFFKVARELFESFETILTKRFFTVPSMRGFDQLSYQLGEEPKERPETPDEVATTFAYRREVEERVAGWMQQVTGVRISVHIIPKKQVELRSIDGYNIYHEGFGTGQLVKPLVQIAMAPKDSLIAVEEPEIHLHPQAQVRLCDTLAEIAKTENKQILLTTHSEHILTGFLNIVAEGKLKPQDLSVYYFEKKNGEAKATQLPVDSKGMIAGGLKGFSEVELGKLERHLQATSQKSE